MSVHLADICFFTSSDSVSKVWSKDHMYQSHLGCLLECRFLGLPPEPLNQCLQKQLWAPDFLKGHQEFLGITVEWELLPRERFLGFSHHLWCWMRASFLGESTLPCDHWIVELKYPYTSLSPPGKPGQGANLTCSHASSLGTAHKVLLHATDRDGWEALENFSSMFLCSGGWDETEISLISSL